MKSLYKKIIITLSMGTALTIPMAKAEIPFTQARGMYTQTLDDRKDLSPFWGMVAIHGRMLEHIRFFGHYTTQPNPEVDETDNEATRTVDQGRDKIAELIRRLFNSPDGVQFVATTYEADPVGNLSRNLGKINDIIEVLLSNSDNNQKVDPIASILDGIIEPIEKMTPKKLIRFQKLQALQKSEQIISRNRELIKNKIDILKKEALENLNEKAFKSGELQSLKSKKYLQLIELAKKMEIEGIEDYEKIPNKDKNNLITSLTNKDLEKKAIAKLTDQELRDLAKEHGIEFSDEKWQTGKENPLRNLIVNALYINQVKILTMQALSDYANSKNLPFDQNKTESELINSFAAKLSDPEISKAISKQTTELFNDEVLLQLKANNKAFAKLLVEAYGLQKEIADPNIPDKYLYPKNIVITALLGFFVKIADDSRELMALKYLMKPEYQGNGNPFNKEQYEQLKTKYIENAQMPNLQLLKDPELTLLMTKGYTAYEYPYVEPITYSGSTIYRKGDFADCGETSLRNVLGIFLSAKNQGKISKDALESLTKKIKPIADIQMGESSPFKKMITFFDTYPDMTLGGVKKVHNDWAEVVSNLNNGLEAKTLDDVYYGLSSKQNSPKDYEFKAALTDKKGKIVAAKGIINMLNVIAKLIPDEVLQAPWSESKYSRYNEIAAKLTRFCELLSRDRLKLSWYNKEYEEEEKEKHRKKVENEFMNVIFTINDQPVFNWEFVEGHFQLYPIPAGENDWRWEYSKQEMFTPDNFMNEWMASLFRRWGASGEIVKEFFPLSLAYNGDLKNYETASSAIGWVLRENMVTYKPLIMRWIHKSIPLNDFRPSWDLWSTLMTTNNSVDLLEILFKKGEIIKTLGDYWLQGLSIAARHGQIKVMEFLLKHGAPVGGDERERESDAPWRGNSPLKEAIVSGKKETVEFLLDKGARLDIACDDNHNMPLHIAASLGNEEIINILINKGADVNIRRPLRDNSYTPLTAAIEGKHFKTAELLITKGAQVNIYAGLTKEIINYLIKLSPEQNEPKNEEAIQKILNQALANFGELTKGNNNIPSDLCKKFMGDLAKKLSAALRIEVLDSSFDPLEIYKIEMKDRRTPLYDAIQRGDMDGVKFLHDHGADVNAKGYRGDTPLISAADVGNELIIKLLLSVPGIDVNAKNTNGTSALEEAASRGHENIVKLLLDIPTILYNPEDLEQWRIKVKSEELYEAAKKGDIQKMEILLQQGAPINGIKNKYDESAMDNIPLEAAIKKQKSDAIEFLLKKGADANPKVQRNRTLLHQAIYNGNEDAVKLLIEYGADVNAVDDNGDSPLADAVSQGRDNIIKLLIEAPTIKYNPEDLERWRNEYAQRNRKQTTSSGSDSEEYSGSYGSDYGGGYEGGYSGGEESGYGSGY